MTGAASTARGFGEPPQLWELLDDFDAQAEAARRKPPTTRRILDAYDKGVAAVDRARVEALKAYVRENADALARLPSSKRLALHPSKYLDLASYLKDKARWIVDLRLDVSRPLRILDLGVGGGHFPFLARAHGHAPLGLDMDVEMFGRILEAYAIPRVIHTIEPREPLPVTGTFDLITALQMTFNRKDENERNPDEAFWSEDEWAWFLQHLSLHLAYPGRIFLNLNRQAYPGTDRHHADDLMGMFERFGANVDYWKHTVLFELDRPWAPPP